ncbi:hypothetical protein DER46DRAFT_500834, partial [Fusarium sp. MPI-SDFR-AT-0072]
LLEYFKAEIGDIARKKLDNVDDRLESEWRILEECYSQAMDPSGSLDPEQYSLNLTRDDPSSAYRSKRSGFSNMDSRTRVRKQYSTREQKDELDEERETEIRIEWNDFWIRTLNNRLSGPTLFHQQGVSPSATINRSFADVPRYLFRVCDSKSSGLNSNTDVVASVLSQHDEANRRTIGIFSRDHQEASEMLHHHLGKVLSNTQQTNNLVSWSSSLIFVIQYANWRFCNPWFGQPGEIHIFAVDTSKFPRGQFARDKWLLNWFSNVKLSDEETNFRNLRLNRTEYDNGEYLSQVKLHIEGRSCTMSVQGLTNAGLWDMYLAFNVDDVEHIDPVRKEWTNYVKILRQAWLVIRKTTKAEVQYALNIAEKCFPGFNQDDMALLLLSFYDRKLKRKNPSFQNPFSGLLPPVLVDDVDYEEPAEVDRYSKLRKRMSQLSEVSENVAWNCLSNCKR